MTAETRPDVVGARISDDRTLLSVTFDGPLPRAYDDGFSIYSPEGHRTLMAKTGLNVVFAIVVAIFGIAVAATGTPVLGIALVVAAAGMSLAQWRLRVD